MGNDNASGDESQRNPIPESSPKKADLNTLNKPPVKFN